MFLLLFFFVFFFLIFFIKKSICCGYSFEQHRLVDAVQMSAHNICLYKVADKKYIGCDLKTMELLDCAFIGACAVVTSNTVLFCAEIRKISVLLG